MVFSSLHEVSVSVMKLFPVVARAETGGDARAMGGWTPALVCASLALFIAAGVCEVGGGWLVWQSLREVRASHPSRPVPTKLFR